MGTYIRHYDHVRGEPAMIISKPGSKRAFVIALSSAWKYRVERGQPLYGAGGEVLSYDDQAISSDNETQMAIFTVANACKMITDMFGGIHAAHEYAKIASFIEDGLDDLVKMVPEPEKEGKEIGEGKTTIKGKVHHFPIREGYFSC